jgi:hypothetical protein
MEGHCDNTNNYRISNHDNDAEREPNTQRGGLLLCPTTAADHVDAFWEYVQPLLLPNTSHYAASAHSDVYSTETSGGSTWQSKVLQWRLDKQQRAQQLLKEMQRKQREEAEQALQPKRRGRKKRKPEEPATLVEQTATNNEDDPLEWYSENVLANNNNNNKPHKRQRQAEAPAIIQHEVEEYKAHVMLHFWRRHKGSLCLAQLETRVQLSAGKGMSTMHWCQCCFIVALM